MSNLHNEDEPGYAMLGRFWTIPNMLSIARIFLTIPITYLILTEGSIFWILSLIGIAICTDWFDGAVARWSKSVSEWGKVLDPLADKFAASSVVLALVIQEKIPLWFLLVIVVRDVLILAGGAVAAHRLRLVLMSLWWGKVAVFMLSLTVLWALLEADQPLFNISMWITTVLFIYSFILYVMRFIDVMSEKLPEEEKEENLDTGSLSDYPMGTVESELK